MKIKTNILLILAVVLLLAGISVSADAASVVDSGSCGDNLTYTLDSAGTITISGSGDMSDFSMDDAPWYSQKSLIKTVVISNGVTSIGTFAFEDCDKLTSIFFPDSVTNIGESAFNNCNNLKVFGYVGQPEQWSKISIGTNNSKLINVSLRCFGCESIVCENDNTYVVFEDSVMLVVAENEMISEMILDKPVTRIGPWSFSYCSGLTNITIPNSVMIIEINAFSDCYDLTNIFIPKNVTYVGDGAFRNCGSLTGIFVDEEHGYYTSIDGVLYNKDKTKLLQCPGAKTSITIPENIIDIGNSAFYGCSNLISVSIPDSVTTIRSSAFGGCSSLTSITIPNRVTSIGESAFFNCSNLTSITMPDGITSIGAGMFYGCSSLTDVTIPNGVTSIGESAFHGCSSLNNIIIPDGVECLENFTFSDCYNLSSISIPNSVTVVGEYVFNSCNNLKDVYYRGTEEQFEKIRAYFPEEITLHIVLSENVEVISNISSSVTVKFIDVDKKYDAIVARYSGGKMLDYTKYTISGGEEKTIDKTGADEIKIFSWEDITSVKPVYDVANIQMK